LINFIGRVPHTVELQSVRYIYRFIFDIKGRNVTMFSSS